MFLFIFFFLSKEPGNLGILSLTRARKLFLDSLDLKISAISALSAGH